MTCIRRLSRSRSQCKEIVVSYEAPQLTDNVWTGQVFHNLGICRNFPAVSEVQFG